MLMRRNRVKEQRHERQKYEGDRFPKKMGSKKWDIGRHLCDKGTVYYPGSRRN